MMAKSTNFKNQPTVRELIDCLLGYDADSVVTIASGELFGGGDAVKFISEAYAIPILPDSEKVKNGLPQEVAADYRVYAFSVEGAVKVVFIH